MVILEETKVDKVTQRPSQQMLSEDCLMGDCDHCELLGCTCYCHDYEEEKDENEAYFNQGNDEA